MVVRILYKAGNNTVTIEERGQAIYDTKLRDRLEASDSGKAVAIHLDSEDFAVNRNWARAMRELRQRHPEGELYTLFIGPPTRGEIALATLLRSEDKP